MDNQPVNSEIEKFVQLSKSEKNVKQKNRYDAVLLYLEGRSHREISEVLHILRRTVSGYLSLYTEGGAEALLIRKQLGRSKFLTDEQEKELVHIISTCTSEEADVGIFANWTAPLACRLVEERFQVRFPECGMRDLFSLWGSSTSSRLTESMRALNWPDSWITKWAMSMWSNTKNMMLKYFLVF